MLLFSWKAISINASVRWAQNCFSASKRKQTNTHTHTRGGYTINTETFYLDCVTSRAVAILVHCACPTTADLSSIFLPSKSKSPGSHHGKGDASQRLRLLLGNVSQSSAVACHWVDLPLNRSHLWGGVTPAALQQSPSTRPSCFQYTWSVTRCYWNMYEMQKSGLGAQGKISTRLLQASQKSHSALKPPFPKPGYWGFLQSKEFCRHEFHI